MSQQTAHDLVIISHGAASVGMNLHRASLVLQFGAHKGKRVDECPDDYVLWLADPKHDVPSPPRPGRSAGGQRPLPAAIVAEARRLASGIREARARKALIVDLKRGKPHDRPHPLYLIECDGDMHSLSGDFVFDATIHDSLDAALAVIAAEYPTTWEPEFSGAGLEQVRQTPDQEDDRIIVWEILPTGHIRAAWGFFGYHWSADDHDCGQCALPGDSVDLYTIADRL